MSDSNIFVHSGLTLYLFGRELACYLTIFQFTLPCLPLSHFERTCIYHAYHYQVTKYGRSSSLCHVTLLGTVSGVLGYSKQSLVNIIIDSQHLLVCIIYWESWKNPVVGIQGALSNASGMSVAFPTVSTEWHCFPEWLCHF